MPSPTRKQSGDLQDSDSGQWLGGSRGRWRSGRSVSLGGGRNGGDQERWGGRDFSGKQEAR